MSKTSWNEKISLYARFHARRKFTCQDSKKFWGTFKMSKISKGWFCFEPFKRKKLSCKKWCFWKSWSKLLAWTFWSATCAFPCRVHAAVGVLISDLEWSKRFHMQNYISITFTKISDKFNHAVSFSHSDVVLFQIRFGNETQLIAKGTNRS